MYISEKDFYGFVTLKKKKNYLHYLLYIYELPTTVYCALYPLYLMI